MSSKSYRIAIRRLATRVPALEVEDLHKIAQNYIQAGVRGADLVQRVINSSGADPRRIRAFVRENYPTESEDESVPPLRL
jgi:hypothetical protein